MTDDVEVWYFMIPVAMVFVGIAIVLFFWSVKSDQFEDLDRHGSSILFDDDDASHQQAQRQPLADQQEAADNQGGTDKQDLHS
ncbi:cbb3-type cytochrome oxidase assembly protein CcoS [Oceanisphaera sp.]|uniref:cbb3-type cytochrome oxidase assembly protein CcoS n=1 Tax=Oceanisphaera sp. TaxID=1929979 RepID=UPI003A92D494